MNYAIVELLGKQYQVTPGDKLALDGLLGKEGDTIAMGRILMVNNGAIEVGTPEIKGDIKLKVIALTKSPKIRVATYKAKSRHRKVIGHRQDQTTVEVLEVAGIKAEVKAKALPKAEPKAKAPAKKTAAKKSQTKKSE
jgi:large subunit ribosomal protein L21